MKATFRPDWNRLLTCLAACLAAGGWSGLLGGWIRPPGALAVALPSAACPDVSLLLLRRVRMLQCRAAVCCSHDCPAETVTQRTGRAGWLAAFCCPPSRLLLWAVLCWTLSLVVGYLGVTSGDLCSSHWFGVFLVPSTGHAVLVSLAGHL